jgi:hypothetical protein
MPILLGIPVFLLAAADPPAEEARNEIIAAYQRSLDALQRGDADAAMQIDTKDWVSVTVGQKPRTWQEIDPFIRRDIATLKPPPGWSATWKPDYKRNGTSSGIQIYDLKLDGNKASCSASSATREPRSLMAYRTPCGAVLTFAIPGSKLPADGNAGCMRN